MDIVRWQVRTMEARHRLFILRTAFDALSASLPERAAEMAVTKAKATTDWQNRTGKTRESIRSRQVGAYKWRFIAKGASLWLNEGTGLYGPRRTPITPKNSLYLRFKIGNRVLYKRFVRGQKPTHFVDKARDDAEAFMMSDFAMQLNGIINDHNR